MDKEGFEPLMWEDRGCYYCDCVYTHKPMQVLASAEYTGLTMEYWKGAYYLVAHGEDTPRVKIEYCPFCGRKLTENEDEGEEE